MYVQQPLDIGTSRAMIYTCKGSVTDVSFSDWLNTYIYVTDCGDIRAGYARQLVSTFLDAHRKNKGVSH